MLQKSHFMMFVTCWSLDYLFVLKVCLRSSPMYHHGAVGFNVVDGAPKVGTLMSSAWSLNDTCRFKIRRTTLR